MFLMFMANGTEEVEAIATLDILRRADIECFTVSINDTAVISGSHSVQIICDIKADDIQSLSSVEGVIIPGGMPGTLNIEKSEKANEVIDYCFENDKYICAICAAPSVLGHKNILQGKKALAFPGFESDLYGAEIADGYVCRDGKIITGRGMGCAVLFGLEIVAAVKGKDFSDRLKATLQCSI